jgi:hypothetical protein
LANFAILFSGINDKMGTTKKQIVSKYTKSLVIYAFI